MNKKNVWKCYDYLLSVNRKGTIEISPIHNPPEKKDHTYWHKKLDDEEQ